MIIEAARSLAACFFREAEVQIFAYRNEWIQAQKVIRDANIKDFNNSPMSV